jgi:tetratricopeptide (TPR) repeat protein
MIGRLLHMACAVVLVSQGSFSGVDQGRCQSAIADRDRATAFYREGDLHSATVELGKVVQSCPVEPFYRFMLANALYRAENLQESARAYALFLESRPNDFEAHMSLGFAMFELGDKRKALEEWLAATHIQPESPFARAALAVGLYSTGDVSNALVQYQRAAAIDPRYGSPAALTIDIRWKATVVEALKAVKDIIRSEGDK